MTTVTTNTNQGIVLNNGLTINAGTVNITGNSEETGLILNGSITSDGSMTLRANSYSFNSANVLGQGTLTIEPLTDSNSFSEPFNTTNLTLGSGLTGLTIGKQTNTSDITFGSNTTIAGPITAYGGAIDVNANITATGGDILLDADTGVGLATGLDGINVANNITIKTINTGNITFIGRSGNGNVNNVMGYNDASGTIITSAGALSITGFSNSTSNTGTRGFTLYGTYTAENDITLIGQDDTGDDAILNGASVTSINGGIDIFANTPGKSFYMYNTNTLTAKNDIRILADRIFLGTISFDTEGQVNFLPRMGSSTFAASLTIGSGVTFNSDITGIFMGNTTNDKDITINTPISITGPITAYGGTITLNANLNTTNGGDISIYSDNPLGGLSMPRSLTAAGAFKYIPRGTAFTAAVTYPITNLTATSTGLTIGKPTNNKNITINADVTGGAGIELYGGDVNINSNLKTTNSGNMVLKGNTTIAAGKYIESNGNFTHEGDITFKSNATGTAAFGTLGGTFTTTSGVARTERFIPAKRAFRFLSPSVTTTGTINANWQENAGTAANLGTHITGTGGATNGFDVTASNNPSLFTHDNANGTRSAVTNTNVNTLTAGTPYRLMVRGDRTVDMSTNTPTPTVTTLRANGTLYTGNFTPTLNQAADGYSFIGNPYQAPVNIKTVLAAATDVNNAVVYYWDPTLNLRGGWVARNLINNTNDVTSSFNEFIQPNQAVFIKNSSSVTAPALTFTETDKAIANAAAGVFKTNNNTALLRLKLTASIDNQMQEIDGALVLFNEDYSWDVTQDDITKMGNLDEQVSFKVNNTELAIASQNNPIANAVLPISFTKNRQENYQWEFELENYNGLTPYLFDALTQSYTQIENGTNVAFTTANQDAEAIANRFTVVFQANLSTTDYLQNIALYPNPAKANQTEYILQGVDANSSVTMFNLLGQQIPVGVEALQNSLRVTPKTSLSKGVYLVTIKTNQGSTSIKWIIE